MWILLCIFLVMTFDIRSDLHVHTCTSMTQNELRAMSGSILRGFLLNFTHTGFKTTNVHLCRVALLMILVTTDTYQHQQPTISPSKHKIKLWADIV